MPKSVPATGQALRLLILYVLFLCLAAPITPATVTAQNSAVRHVFIRLQQKAIPTITRGPGSRRSRALITRTGILGFIKQDLIELCRQIRQRQVQVMKESMKNLGAVAMLPSRITSLYSEHLLYYRDTNWRICPVVRYSGLQFWSVTNNAPPFYPTASAVFWPFVGRSLR